MLLVGIALWSPYLPATAVLGQKIRADNLLVPATAVFLLLQRRRIPSSLRGVTALYLAFLAWLLVTTAVTAVNPGSIPVRATLVQMVAGADFYARPLLIMFVATQLSRGRVDAVAKILVIAGAPAVIVGVIQSYPASADWLSPIVLRWFDPGRGADPALFLSRLVAVGRSPSIFGQVSTFGLFCAMYFGLLIQAWPFRGTSPVLQALRALLAVVAAAGGMASGSKVFTGGLLLLALLQLARWRPGAHRNGLVVMAGAAAILLATQLVDVRSASLWSSRFSGSLVETYFASRFATDAEGLAPKIERTGALRLVSEHPFAGGGLQVVDRTTDSLYIGLAVVCGAVGVVLWLLVTLAVLRVILRRSQNRHSAFRGAFARWLLFVWLLFVLAGFGFPAAFQDRAGDVFWLSLGVLSTAPRSGEADL